MKNIKIFFVSLMLIALTACGNKVTTETPLEDIPSDLSLSDVKKSGCVVFEDGDITDGEEGWEEFLAKVENKEPATVRIANYYILDEEKCDSVYYESAKDEYPMLFIHELSYDGESYTIRWFEEGEEISRNYKYMKKMVEEPVSDSAEFLFSIEYVLLNDETVTKEDIFRGLISSQMGAAIDHYTVFTDYVYEGDEIKETPKPTISGTKNIWIMGDSIAGYNSPKKNDSAGWGSYLQLYLQSEVSVKNTAVGGASASSYLENGVYDIVMDNLQKDDIVLIQFGHNDAYNMDIYTDPYADSSTEGSFKNMLKNDFILPILEKGAHPVLATSVVAADFDSSGELYTMIYADHAQAMRDLAKECNEEGTEVYLIDTYAITDEYYREIGKYEAQQLHSGGTHYNRAGAIYAAGIIAEELNNLGFECCYNLRSTEEVTEIDKIGGFDICALGVNSIVTNLDIEQLSMEYQYEGMDKATADEKAKDRMFKTEALHRKALAEGLEVNAADVDAKVDQYMGELNSHELSNLLNDYFTEDALRNYLSYSFERELLAEQYVEKLESEYDSTLNWGISFEEYLEEYKTSLAEEEKYVTIINRGYNVE